MPNKSPNKPPKTALAVFLALACVLPLSCGGGGETESGPLRIGSAQWREEPEPKAVVSGEWSVGTSTPPICDLLEGEEGEPSDWYDPSNRIELDNNRFYREFTRGPDSGEPVRLNPETEYYVRCRTNGVTGNTVQATAPVRGEVPAT